MTALSDIYSIGSTLYNLLTGQTLRTPNEDSARQTIDYFTYLGEWNFRQAKEVIASCWRLGRTYESARHLAEEIKGRLKILGVEEHEIKEAVKRAV